MGFLRLFLALSVIAGHARTTVFGFDGIGAWYAVNFFFVISGFYMAMVLNEKYYDTNPFIFYKSRVLRLFPIYYVGLVLALIVSHREILEFFESLTFGGKLFFLLQNVFILGQDISNIVCVKTIGGECASSLGLTINPPAWSLAVELLFYLAAPFILKSSKKTFFFILVGCAYLLSLKFINFPLSPNDYFSPFQASALNYYFFPASFVFFGSGALAYHLHRDSSQLQYFVALATLGIFSCTTTVMPFWHLWLVSLAVPSLFKYTADNRFDRTIGEWSYPLYILHFPILLAVKAFAGIHPEYFRFVSLGSFVAIISGLIAVPLYVFIDKRISHYRHSAKFAESNAASLPARSATARYVAVLYGVLPGAIILSIYALQGFAGFHRMAAKFL